MHRWFSPRALLLHLEFWLIVAGCAVATWWQAHRALAGNGLSWFYTFEWPILAGIAIARVVAPHSRESRGTGRPAAGARRGATPPNVRLSGSPRAIV